MTVKRNLPKASVDQARVGRFGLRLKKCVWLGVSLGLDVAFLDAD